MTRKSINTNKKKHNIYVKIETHVTTNMHNTRTIKQIIYEQTMPNIIVVMGIDWKMENLVAIRAKAVHSFFTYVKK